MTLPSTSAPTTVKPSSGVRLRDDAPPDQHLFIQEQIHADWASRLRVPAHHADDLIQGALLIVLEHWRDVPPEHRQAYFFTVIRNGVRHHFRAERIAKRYEPMLQALLRDERSRLALPDENLLRKQVIEAAYWLVAHVDESRRDVAERRLLDGQAFEDIIRETGMKPKTVYSQWARARKDMRRALERETKKQGRGALLAVAAAILAGLWLWLVAGGRRIAGALAALGDHLLGRPAASGRNRPSALLTRAKRSRLGALLACALLPVAVIAHSAIKALPSREATALAPPMFALDVGPGVELHVVAAHPTTNTERERDVATRGQKSADRADHQQAAEGLPPALPISQVGDGAPGRDKRGLRPKPPQPGARRTAPAASAADPDLDAPRGLLLRATIALGKGRVDHARLALRDYERMFPENPIPPEYARLAAALRALDRPSGVTIR